MESHKCISKLIIVFSFNIFIIDILWNRVVDIKQCNCIIGNAKSDVLTKCSSQDTGIPLETRRLFT